MHKFYDIEFELMTPEVNIENGFLTYYEYVVECMNHFNSFDEEWARIIVYDIGESGIKFLMRCESKVTGMEVLVDDFKKLLIEEVFGVSEGFDIVTANICKVSQESYNTILNCYLGKNNLNENMISDFWGYSSQSETSSIRFICNDMEKMRKTVDNIAFQAIPGVVEIIIDGRNLTKGANGEWILDEVRILEFTCRFIKSSRILIENNSAETLGIQYGDYQTWCFVIRKEADNVYLSLYKKNELTDAFKDERMPAKDFYMSLLKAIIGLQYGNFAHNPFVRGFDIYKKIMEEKYLLVSELIKNKIFSESEIEDAFNA